MSSKILQVFKISKNCKANFRLSTSVHFSSLFKNHYDKKKLNSLIKVFVLLFQPLEALKTVHQHGSPLSNVHAAEVKQLMVRNATHIAQFWGIKTIINNEADQIL